MQTIFEIYSTIGFGALFSIWSTKGALNWFIKVILLAGFTMGVLVNYQNFY